MRKLSCALFRRAGKITVTVNGKAYEKRGVIREAADLRADYARFDFRQYGKTSVPLYIYTGNAFALLDGAAAAVQRGEEKFTVLAARCIYGLRGSAYVEALLERQVSGIDGE